MYDDSKVETATLVADCVNINSKERCDLRLFIEKKEVFFGNR